MRSTTSLAALAILAPAAAATVISAAPAAAAPPTAPVVCTVTRSVDDYAPAVLDDMLSLLRLSGQTVPHGEVGLTCAAATERSPANLCAIAFTPGGTIAIGPAPRADGSCL
ncbi:hypothetical protein [Nocardia stercoris]|nr:hypothetical protein [Nocardia stercoris]